MMFFPGFGGGVEMKGGRGGAAAAAAAADVVDADYNDDDRQQRRMGSFLLPKPQRQQHGEHHVQAMLQQQKPECYSDEANSRSDDAGAGDSEQRQRKRQRKSSAQPATSVRTTGAAGGEVEGSTVGVAKRARGRPPGSKNKPKAAAAAPAVNIRDAGVAPSPAAMRPHVLEVADGRDVVDALSRFSRRQNLGLCILAGTGLVSNVILRQPLASPSPASGSADISFPGHFEILSISAVFLPPSFTTSPPSSAFPEGSGAISVTLAGTHGRVFGGLVAGPLTAVGTVTILAAAFGNPTYHRLPAEDDASAMSVSGGGDAEATRAQAPQAPRHQWPPQHNTTSRHHQQHHRRQKDQRSASPPSSSSAAAGAAQNNHCHHPGAALGATTAGEARGMPMYSRHLPSDVIWPPAAARSPPF